MAPTATAKKRTPRNVTVVTDDDHQHHQPPTFNLCPLGVQFYAPKPMDEFTMIELDVDAKNAAGQPTKVTCKGAVVRCQREPEPNRYRIWVKFIDVPAGTKECIRCTAKAGKHLCSYCENF